MPAPPRAMASVPSLLCALALMLAAPVRAELHELVTRLDGANVHMAIPMDGVVGSKPSLRVRVAPDGAGIAPGTYRMRLGMPDHGHWITPQSSAAIGEEAVHRGDLPMAGRYRLRVWLDYPDGRVLRTGADFQVDELKTHAPTPAPH